MVPNAEHSLAGHEISLLFGIRAFYLSVMNVRLYTDAFFRFVLFCFVFILIQFFFHLKDLIVDKEIFQVDFLYLVVSDPEISF